MSQKKTVQPIIEEVKELQKPKEPGAKPPEPPPKSAELDQDPGGGYNPDGTYPQT